VFSDSCLEVEFSTATPKPATIQSGRRRDAPLSSLLPARQDPILQIGRQATTLHQQYIFNLLTFGIVESIDQSIATTKHHTTPSFKHIQTYTSSLTPSSSPSRLLSEAYDCPLNTTPSALKAIVSSTQTI
jgi:hypothetical protein